jgi:hypothetical protein
MVVQRTSTMPVSRDLPAMEPGHAPSSRIPDPPVLAVYQRLVDQFTRERVAWCYWKSSRRVAEGLAGQSDLDILVATESWHAARRVLLACGFRMFIAVASRADLSVECYLTYDEASGKIAQVDLHTRLMLGSALLKTHRLPWEKSLIRRAVANNGAGIPILDAASEAVLLVIRASLELRWADPVAARHWHAVTQKFALDRALLARRTDLEALRRRASELLDEHTAKLVVEAWLDQRPLHSQGNLRRGLRRALARFCVTGAAEAWLRGTWRGIQASAGFVNAHSLHWPRPWSRRVAGGGIVVAVIAVDGAGKSTLVRGLQDWLAGVVDVLPLYFGTGDGRPTWFLAPFKLLVPLVSKLLPTKPQGSSHGTVTDAKPSFVYSLLLTLWASAVALEKRTKLRSAHRAACRGMLVITDRFPQDETAQFNDGPLLSRLNGVPRWLRAFEASAYALARELRPDLVIKLIASPELIASREPTMDHAVIQSRTEALDQLRLGGAPITLIPASLPAAAVLYSAKTAIWRAL